MSGTAGDVLTIQSDGRVVGAPLPSAPVLSVFGRFGAVVALANDYAASLIANDSSVAGASVRAALNTLAGLIAAIPPAPVFSVFGRVGAVVAQLNDYAASLVANDSNVAGATVKDALEQLSIPPYVFGSGSDGDLTAAAGTTTLTRDTYYRTVTLSGTAAIETAGFKLFILDYDATNAPANAIRYTANNGVAGANAGSGGRTGGAGLAGGSGGGPSTAGGVGGTSVSGTGNGPNATVGINAPTDVAAGGLGGTGGAGGAAGASTAGAGGTGGTASNRAVIRDGRPELFIYSVTTNLWARVAGGTGGGGGGGGGATAGGSTGGGGGGGGGGGVLYLRIARLTVGPSTAAGGVAAKGGNGANAGSPNATGTLGGAGGGAGGGGGFVHAVVGRVIGGSVAGFFTADGGNGGNASSGFGGGLSGVNGPGGQGGTVVYINLAAQTSAVANHNNAVGQVGGQTRVSV